MQTFFDERDAHFGLFEWLPVETITKLPPFQDFNVDVQKLVLAEMAKFCRNELAPIWQSGDREGCHWENGQVKTPKGYKEAYQKFAAQGFIGPDISPQYGGQGLPVSLCVAFNEVLIGTNISFSLYTGLTRGAAHLIESCATEALAKIFCEKMFTGTWAGTMCLTEPDAGSAVGDITTAAKANADGTYQIQGRKIFISSGDHDITENIIHLVLARIEGDAPGTKGISLFIVPKIWVNADGTLAKSNDVSCVNIEHKMGIHASSTCSLNFGENNDCRGFLVGEASQGMRYMFRMMNEARLLVAIQGLSIAGSAYENAWRYAKDREQGGKAIIEYPSVKRDLSIAKAYVEGLRALIYSVGHHIDLAHHAEDLVLRERSQNRIDLLTPICKAYASDYGFKVTEIAMQVLGGYGYCNEYPIEQFMRDIKIASIYEGTNGIQALDLIGRKLSLKNGKLFQELYEDCTAFTTEHVGHSELKDEMQQLQKALEQVGQVVIQLVQWGTEKQVLVLQVANPFLEMCGHTVVSQALLSQAVTAHKVLQKHPSDAQFYKNKILTAKFFANHKLPQVTALAKEILKGDLSAQQIVF